MRDRALKCSLKHRLWSTGSTLLCTYCSAHPERNQTGRSQSELYAHIGLFFFFLWNILSSYYRANKTHLGILNCSLLRENRIEVSQSFGCSYTVIQQIARSFSLFIMLSPDVFCHRPLNSLWVISCGRRWPWRTRQLLTTGTAASLLLDRLGQLWGVKRLRNSVRFCLAQTKSEGIYEPYSGKIQALWGDLSSPSSIAAKGWKHRQH